MIGGYLMGFLSRDPSTHHRGGVLMGAGDLSRPHGSLDEAMRSCVTPGDVTSIPALTRWVAELTSAAGTDLSHLLPDPNRGSACKRLCLYLRWMVRTDAIDPGGWQSLSPSQLIIPLDVHMHRVALSLGLTTRKAADLKTAMEVTDSLRRVDPTDPLRFDFALTRPGILNISP
jgi:uncharacterized protein (TIGR02757 family)